MCRKPVKCFIVEGESRDTRFINNMVATLFRGKYQSITICLPASQNIYMLYNKIREDEFNTDLIELLKENPAVSASLTELGDFDRQSIDEVFLFFDYDVHQENLSTGQTPIDSLKKMIDFFDNETEQGKLYVSYPMVEALFDYCESQCDPYTECIYPVDKLTSYKEAVGNNRHASHHFSKYGDWKKVMEVFGMRIRCLFSYDSISYSLYKQKVTVKSIFEIQKNLFEKHKKVFVLSAFPEFLLDYFISMF